MKLTTVLLLSACLHVAAAGRSQKVTITMKNVSIQKVFEEVGLQAGITILYKKSYFADAKPVSVNVKDASPADVIKACLSGLPLIYSEEGNSIVIRPVPDVNSGKPHFPAVYDPPPVIGIITDQNGNPLAGINVTVKGMKSGVTSNEKGEFLLNADDGAVLVISSVEYEMQEIKVSSLQIARNIVLVKKISPLDEVHIIAYGTTTKRYSVGSISKVSSDEIAAQPVSNPLEALEGRVPGLVVSQTTGAPGSAVKVQVRGQNSLSSKPSLVTPLDQPLIIIDGVPFSPQNTSINQYESISAPLPTAGNANYYGGMSPFNSINPMDIESVEVLRDADATAIYGSRGANGVILVTTKRGKIGKTKLGVNIYTGESRVTNTVDMMNTQQYLAMRNKAFANDGITPNTTIYDPGYAPDLLLFDTTKYTDWKKYFLGGTAHTTDANISLNGGNANTQFLVGAGYHHETYVYPGDYAYNRGSFNANFHHNSSNKKLTVDFSANYSYDKNNSSNNVNLLAAFTLPPDFPDLKNPDGSIKWEYNGVDLGSYASVGSITNPIAYLKQPYSLKKYNLLSHFKAGYEILSGLTLSSDFGYNTFYTNEYSANPKIAMDPVTSMYYYSTAQFGTNNYQTWIIEPQAEYKKSIGLGKLNIQIGSTFQQTTNNRTSIYGEEYSNDVLLNSIVGAARTTASGQYSLYKYNAVFGIAKYIWNNKYIVSLNARRDGSSRFAPGRQFGNFGSVGAGWIFSEEPFIKNALPVVSYGKLRSSYGTTGSDNIGDYNFLSTYAPIPTFNYQGSAGYDPQHLYNPNFSWQSTKKFEAALELGLFKDRFIANVTWYRNESGNQLVSYSLPIQTGFNNVILNAPYTVRNSGWEIMLNSSNIRTRRFSWNTAFTLTVPKNRLTSFPGIEKSPYQAYYVVGQPISVLQYFRYAGVNDTTGIFQFYDVKGERTYNPADGPASTGRGDRVIIGNLDPKFFGGLRNTIGFKGFELDIFIQFVKQMGQSYLGQVYAINPVAGSMNNLPAGFVPAWQKEGDHSGIQQFSTQYGNAYTGASAFTQSSGAYADASFIRFKTISLSYNLPADFLKRVKAEGCRVYVNCQNLFTITGYKGNDPETSSLYSLPPLRTIAAGLQFTF